MALPLLFDSGMGFHRFEDIIAWQIANRLKLKVLALCRRESLKRDDDLYKQLISAARSGPRNIAEGFGRWRHRDFARFVRQAKASEIELLNHFLDARDSGHISEEERAGLSHTARQAIKAANGLIRSLENSPDPRD
jgi:four helix bundle protein